MNSLIFRKWLFGLLLLLMASNARAQFGLSAGWQHQTHTFKSNQVSRQPSNGVYFEAGFDLYPGDYFSITPGLKFAAMSCNDLMLVTNTDYLFGSVEEMFLSMPLKASYMLDISDSFMIYPFGKTSLDYGLKSTYETQENGTVNLYESGFNRWDVKAGGGIGLLLFDMFKLECGYEFGLIDRMRDLPSCTNQLYVGLTFSFGEGPGGNYGGGYGSFGGYGGYGGYGGSIPAPPPSGTYPDYNAGNATGSGSPYVDYKPFQGLPSSSSSGRLTRDDMDFMKKMHSRFSTDGVVVKLVKVAERSQGTAIILRISNKSRRTIDSASVEALFVNYTAQFSLHLKDAHSVVVDIGHTEDSIFGFLHESNYEFGMIENVIIRFDDGEVVKLGIDPIL